MKARTIISLERSQLRELKARAHAEGVSVAAFVRGLVTQSLARDRQAGAASAGGFERIVGLGFSGRDDIADRHDAALADALRREHDR